MQMPFSDISENMDIEILWISSIPFHEKAAQINPVNHCHSFYEAHICLSGAFEIQIGEGHTCRLCAEEGILIAPQAKHNTKECVSGSIRFTLAFRTKENTDWEKLLSKGFFCFPVNLRIIDCIDIILFEAAQKNTFSSVIMQNRLFEIICEMLRAIGIDDHFRDKSSRSSENFIVQKAKQYISDNKDKLLSCSEVAGYCHYNAKYLSRIFLKQTDQTLLEYIHHEKMVCAEKLLKDESLTLKQVSDSLGFTNEYYFNRFFKRKNGITPGKYRKMLKSR